MDIPATQILADADDNGAHNLIIDLPTPQKRIHQVANLWVGKQKYPIFEGINKVGRNPTADIYLTDITVSKFHAEIEAHANSAFICDLESSNKSRINNMVLRPQRFYQLEDGTQLSFGTVDARYLFLRGFDNTILVPDTPIPGRKIHYNSSISSRNLNNSLIDESDDDSIVAASQLESNDVGVFAKPSSRSRQKRLPKRSIREEAEATVVSIHDIATQPYVQREDVDDTIHICQTQKIPEFEICQPHQSIHDFATQKFDAGNIIDTNIVVQKVGKSCEKQNLSVHEIETQISDSTDEPSRNNSLTKYKSLEKKAQSIHDAETQKFDTIDEPNSKSSKASVPLNEELVSIHNLETQTFGAVAETQQNLDTGVRYDLVNDETQRGESRDHHSEVDVPTLANKLNKNQCEMNEDVRVNGKSSNGVDSDGGFAMSKDSISNISSNHIINETDDESETDEEGVFSNVNTDNVKNNNCKQLSNKIDESDSETDEEGEFEAMRPNCRTSCINSNKYDHDKKTQISNHTTNAIEAQIPNDLKLSCSNERFNCQSPILAKFDNLPAKHTQNEVPSADDDLSLLPTQIVRKIPIIEENDEIINSDDDDLPTQCQDNTKKQHKTGLMNEDEDDDEMPVTPPKLTPSNRKSIHMMKKAGPIDFIPDVNDGSDEEPTQIIQMPVPKLSKVNDDYGESTQVIPTSESKTTKKNAQLHQSGGGSDKNTIARTRFPRVVIEKDSVSKNNATAIIAKRKTITESDTLTIDDDNYFDETTPTQVIDVQAAKIDAEKASGKQARNAESQSISGNLKPRGDTVSDENIVRSRNGGSPTKALAGKSRMSLRLRRNDNTSLNDSVTENLANLFGGESEENHINVQSPMATQILEEVLGNSDLDTNQTITRLRNVNDSKPSSSPDTDSQDVYFSKLRTKRKHNVIPHSQDSTGSEGGDKTSSSPVKSFVFSAGTSGFKDGVAISSEEKVGIRKSKTKQLRRNSKLQGNVKDKEEIGSCDNNVLRSNDGFANVDDLESAVETVDKPSENEEDDILAGLPEVKIYGTAAYPASPTSSVCSLDELEIYEKKRRRRLAESAAKKALSKKKSLSKVSLDNLQKVESGSTATANKILESSDDEELNYEELKKMAVGFIAADTRPKELTVKLEKMKSTTDYRSTSEDTMKSMSVSPTVKSKASRKTRGRPKKKDNSVMISQAEENSTASDEKIEEEPPRKRARLPKDPMNVTARGSNSSSESHEVSMIQEQSILERGSRSRKIPVKPRSLEIDSAYNQLTPLKSGKGRAKVINSPSTNTRKTNHKVLFTGLPGSDYEADVKSCGGTIIERSEQATILVTDKIRRTNKFFCAISRHIPIVSETWIKDSAAQKTFVDWNEYILDDPTAEAKYNFKLRESLERASKKKLFEGFVFVVTPRVSQPGFDEIKSMVQMSGGKALVRAPKLWLPDTIIISCTEDIPRVQDILSKVSKNIRPRVHTVEFILLGILKQELDYTANQIQLPED